MGVPHAVSNGRGFFIDKSRRSPIRASTAEQTCLFDQCKKVVKNVEVAVADRFAIRDAECAPASGEQPVARRMTYVWDLQKRRRRRSELRSTPEAQPGPANDTGQRDTAPNRERARMRQQQYRDEQASSQKRVHFNLPGSVRHCRAHHPKRMPLRWRNES